VQYARIHGARVSQQIAAGVSGEIRFEDGPDGPIVVKQALGKLKVAADWFASPTRNAVEAACLQTLAEVLGPHAVPRVLWVNRETHTFAMERLPARLLPWKARLMACDIDVSTARRVGDLLGQMHARTAARTELAQQFDDLTFLFDLRVHPYHHRVAERHPELAPAVNGVIERMLASRQCLVHGDYSPKNLMSDGADVVVLDCEVAHWGDPRFDVAFCLSHLLLKTVHSPSCPSELVHAAEAYLDAYARSGLPVLDEELTRATGCLVLARVVGDSPVEYLTTPELKKAAFALGERLLMEPGAPMDCPRLALDARG
jgi:5-methylthioribose kinase